MTAHSFDRYESGIPQTHTMLMVVNTEFTWMLYDKAEEAAMLEDVLPYPALVKGLLDQAERI